MEISVTDRLDLKDPLPGGHGTPPTDSFARWGGFGEGPVRLPGEQDHLFLQLEALVSLNVCMRILAFIYLFSSFYLFIFTEVWLTYNVVPVSAVQQSNSLTCICTFFFRAAPAAYESSQARGLFRATAAGLHPSHSSLGSEPPLRPTP